MELLEDHSYHYCCPRLLWWLQWRVHFLLFTFAGSNRSQVWVCMDTLFGWFCSVCSPLSSSVSYHVCNISRTLPCLKLKHVLIHGNDIMRMVLWSMVADEYEMDNNECPSITQLYLGTLRDHIFNTFVRPLVEIIFTLITTFKRQNLL